MKDEDKGSLPGTESQRTTEGIQEKATDWDHDQGLLAPSLHGRVEDTTLGTTQGWDQPCVLEQTWVPQCLGTKKGSTTEKPQEWAGVTSVSVQGDQAEVPLQQEVIKVPIYCLSPL